MALYTLWHRVISVQTVSGIEPKDLTRTKLKLRTHQGFIRNYDSIVVNSIGKEEGMVMDYIMTIVNLFRMEATNKEYFLSKVNETLIEIHMLLGLRAQESLHNTVRAEQIN